MHDHAHDHRLEGDRRALAGALALIAAFTVVEVVVGYAAGSLALLADAGHMLGDVGSLGLALFAAWLAVPPSDARAELRLPPGGDPRGAGQRRRPRRHLDLDRDRGDRALPQSGRAEGRVGARRRRGRARASTSARPPCCAVADPRASTSRAPCATCSPTRSDRSASSSRAPSCSTTGWSYADPLVALGIAALVLASSWSILRDSVGILLESTPRGIDAEEIGRAMVEVDGVREVHDLHVWTITSGFPSLSAHVLVSPDADCHGKRRELEHVLEERFDLTHTTLQVEHAGNGETIRLGTAERRIGPL